MRGRQHLSPFYVEDKVEMHFNTFYIPEANIMLYFALDTLIVPYKGLYGCGTGVEAK
jgi:hypothetical protein